MLPESRSHFRDTETETSTFISIAYVCNGLLFPRYLHNVPPQIFKLLISPSPLNLEGGFDRKNAF